MTLSSIRNFFRFTFFSDTREAAVSRAFFAVFSASILQFPANFIMRSGFISAAVIANEIFVMAAIPIIIIKIARLDMRRMIPLGRISIAAVVSVVIITIGADVFIDYLTFASEKVFPLPEKIERLYDNLMSVSGAREIVWKIFLLCALPAFCEEIFFRGFCQTSFAAKWGGKIAVVISAFVFAVMHGNPWHIHLYFLLGLLLGCVYNATGILWAPIICHFINNAWTFLCRVFGFKLPIGGRFDLLNFIVIVFAVILFVAGLHFLNRSMSNRAKHCPT